MPRDMGSALAIMDTIFVPDPIEDRLTSGELLVTYPIRGWDCRQAEVHLSLIAFTSICLYFDNNFTADTGQTLPADRIFKSCRWARSWCLFFFRCQRVIKNRLAKIFYHAVRRVPGMFDSLSAFLQTIRVAI